MEWYDETERTFFDSNGAQLGDSRTNIDTWNNGTTDVTNTNTNYHGPDGEWLGNEYSNDQGEAGSMFNSTVAKLDSNGAVTQAWKDLAELTWLVDDANTWTFSFESNFGQDDTISVMVESGSNTFTIGTGSDATTVTETRKHLMSENWDHYGGKEVRDGETVQWNANWGAWCCYF